MKVYLHTVGTGLSLVQKIFNCVKGSFSQWGNMNDGGGGGGLFETSMCLVYSRHHLEVDYVGFCSLRKKGLISFMTHFSSV